MADRRKSPRRGDAQHDEPITNCRRRVPSSTPSDMKNDRIRRPGAPERHRRARYHTPVRSSHAHHHRCMGDDSTR
jgi:hypothetical protein